MSNYGISKIYKYEDVDKDGNVVQKTITMEFNVLTLIKYHGYVGRDLLADMAELARKAGNTNITPDTNIGEITEDDLKSFENISASIEFFSNLIAAMVCTARRHEKLDFEEVIASLPMQMFTDENFMSEIMELITFGFKKK